jgi:hypothetical protein
LSLTRRDLVAGAAASALAAGGLYELVDRLAPAPARATRKPHRFVEQHLLDGLRVITDNDVEVIVPPLHHQIVTARVRRVDRRALEDALRELDGRYEPTPAGLGVTVAWGLPYFRRHVPRQWARYAPFDVRAGKPALLDAIRFPSDPAETVLEQNDVAVLLRSDRLEHIAAASKLLFHDLGVLAPTSIRKGFVGGGLPKKLAVAAQVPGADLIPDNSELFLGFTSTQKAGLGPGRIANIETLGYARIPGNYFHNGTHMHLSHISEDLEAWYINFDHAERVDTAFRPGLRVRVDELTVPQPAHGVASVSQVQRDFRRVGRIGHSSAIQSTSRLQHATVGRDGTHYPKGTAIPQRADFNTLDNPFFWSERRGEVGTGADAGLHFVVFNPTSDDFRRNRLAMDGVLPDGTKLPFAPRARGQGFNAVLRTSHRQNFLVPPRAHRSFPLSELRA